MDNKLLQTQSILLSKWLSTAIFENDIQKVKL